MTPRFPCPTCSRAHAATKDGKLRRHSQPGGGLRCAGSGARMFLVPQLATEVQ